MNKATLSVIAFNNSSNMIRVAHDGTDLIAIMKGGSYLYSGVPADVFEGFLTASSAGKYLNAEVKGKFPFTKLEPDNQIVMLIKDWLNVRINNGVVGDPDFGSNLLHRPPEMIYPRFNNWGMTPVDIVILDPNIEVKYAKDGDAAFDLMARIPETLWVEAGQHKLIPTGLKMQLPPGLAGLILPRSGLANKLRVSIVNAPGLIDSGYTGELGMLVENRGAAAFRIDPYDKVAQYMIVPAITPIFRVVADLAQTARGDGGFGSTGVAKNETNGV